MVDVVLSGELSGNLTRCGLVKLELKPKWPFVPSCLTPLPLTPVWDRPIGWNPTNPSSPLQLWPGISHRRGDRPAATGGVCVVGLPRCLKNRPPFIPAAPLSLVLSIHPCHWSYRMKLSTVHFNFIHSHKYTHTQSDGSNANTFKFFHYILLKFYIKEKIQVQYKM